MASALAAAERGWYVFPAVPGGKRPLWRNWPAYATRDACRIRSYAGWLPGGRTGRGCDNVAIACKPSGLVVLDLDRPKPGPEGTPIGPPPQWRLPGVHDGADVLAVLAERAGQPFPGDTHTVATRRGGLHLYFAAPDGVAILNDSTGRTGWLIDVRAPGHPQGNGGYVIAAGSYVRADENGPAGTYSTLDPRPPIPLRPWLTDLLNHAEPAATAASPGQGIAGVLGARPTLGTVTAGSGGVRCPGAYGARCLDNAVAELRAAVPGAAGGQGRNDTLNRVAFTLGRLVAAGLLPQAEVIAQLAGVAHEIGLGDHEARRSIASGLGAGMAHPRRTA